VKERGTKTWDNVRKAKKVVNKEMTANEFVRHFIQAYEGNKGTLFESDIRLLYREAKKLEV